MPAGGIGLLCGFVFRFDLVFAAYIEFGSGWFQVEEQRLGLLFYLPS